MKNVVLDELKKELNWRERIIIKVFAKTMFKVYNVARIRTINQLLK